MAENILSPYYTNKIANSGLLEYRVHMENQSMYIENAIQNSTRQQLAGNAAIADQLAIGFDSSMARIGTGIMSTIRDQTSTIIASTDVLAKTYHQGFNILNNTIDMGFSGISNRLGEMNAVFSLGFDRISDTLKDMSNEICDRLDAIHDIVNNPLLTQSRELFRRAVISYNKGFFEEALEDIQSAIDKYKIDCISWFWMGKILAFGAGRFSNVINLEKSINAFTQAVKYNSPNISVSIDAKLLSAEIYFYLGVAQYSQSNELSLSKKDTESIKMLDKALESFELSFQFSSKMFESLFNIARCKILQGKKNAALVDLEKLILLDRNYCIKVMSDDDFSDISNEFTNLINRLKHDFFINEVEQNYYKIIDLITDKPNAQEIVKNYINFDMIRSQFTEEQPYFDLMDYNAKLERILRVIKIKCK